MMHRVMHIMRHKSEDGERLRSVTVRLPEKDYLLIREYADLRDLSMNAVISEAVAEYGTKLSRREALERIRLLQESQQKRRTPVADSVELLREMRSARSVSRGGKRE